MSDESLEEMFGKAKNPAVENLCTKIVQNTGVLGEFSNERANVMATGNKVKYISDSSSISTKNNPIMRMVEENDNYRIDSIVAKGTLKPGVGGDVGVIIEVLDDD